MSTFYDHMKENYDIQELKEIAMHGCASGCASTLIYYTDTCAIYDQFSDELHTKLGEWIDEIGETPLFITEQLAYADGFKNAMTWFVAEQYANEIIQTLECEEL